MVVLKHTPVVNNCNVSCYQHRGLLGVTGVTIIGECFFQISFHAAMSVIVTMDFL